MDACSSPAFDFIVHEYTVGRSMNLEAHKKFIGELVEGTGEIIRKYWFDSTCKAEYKADETPVTVADRDTEVYIREQIHKKFPGHGIIGEEFENENEDAEFVWVIDPIDGTKSFINHIPLFGTLLALLKDGNPILGAIHQPISNELAIGDNETTLYNGNPVRVRECNALSEATFLTTDIPRLIPTEGGYGVQEMLKSCKMNRTWGDCYGYMMVATGRADIMIDPVLAPWDLLPVVPVLRGAGACITDWNGKDITLSGASAVAANPVLHKEVIEMLHRRLPSFEID